MFQPLLKLVRRLTPFTKADKKRRASFTGVEDRTLESSGTNNGGLRRVFSAPDTRRCPDDVHRNQPPNAPGRPLLASTTKKHDTGSMENEKTEGKYEEKEEHDRDMGMLLEQLRQTGEVTAEGTLHRINLTIECR